MPFQSEAQRRFLWLKHPEIARKWAKESPGQQELPRHKVVEAMVKKRVGGLQK
jgi:hypothetical protein